MAIVSARRWYMNIKLRREKKKDLIESFGQY